MDHQNHPQRRWHDCRTDWCSMATTDADERTAAANPGSGVGSEKGRPSQFIYVTRCDKSTRPCCEISTVVFPENPDTSAGGGRLEAATECSNRKTRKKSPAVNAQLCNSVRYAESHTLSRIVSQVTMVLFVRIIAPTTAKCGFPQNAPYCGDSATSRLGFVATFAYDGGIRRLACGQAQAEVPDQNSL